MANQMDTTSISKKIKEGIPYLFILISIIVCKIWILSPHNFFIFDDYTNFFNNHFNFAFSIFPHQMYNDRPIGNFLFKFLYDLFRLNSTPYFYFLLILHTLNSFLVYKLFKKYLPKNTVLISAIIFAVWPRSTFAVQWLSALYDLLSVTFILLYLLNYKKYFSLVFYFLALRTKESVLFIPLIPIIYDYFKTKKFITIHKINLALMLFYIILILYLTFTSNYQHFSQDNPYYPSSNPILWIKNIFIYLYLFTNIRENGFIFDGFHPIGIICLFVFIIFTFINIKKNTTKFLIISFILSLLPILPFANRQHKLYLYLPSIFLIPLIVSYFNKKIIYILLIITIYSNFIDNYYLSEKSFWLNTGAKNKTEFNQLKLLPKQQSINKIKNNDPNGIYYYGPGHVINLFFNDPTKL